MPKAKKFLYIILYYMLVIVLVRVSQLVIRLLLSLSLLNVQGPTQGSITLEILGYYLALGIVSFLAYRRCAIKHPQVNYLSLLLFTGLVLMIHLLLIYYGSWAAILKTTSGGWQLTDFLHNGRAYMPDGGLLRFFFDLTLMPDDLRAQSILLRDLIFLIASTLGFYSAKVGRKIAIQI